MYRLGVHRMLAVDQRGSVVVGHGQFGEGRTQASSASVFVGFEKRKTSTRVAVTSSPATGQAAIGRRTWQQRRLEVRKEQLRPAPSRSFDVPSGKRPLFPFVKCFPRNHPSPNSSSLSTSSTRSPLAKVSSSELRAIKSSIGVRNNRVSTLLLEDSRIRSESGLLRGPYRELKAG